MYMYIYIVYIIKAECSFACLSVCLSVCLCVCVSRHHARTAAAATTKLGGKLDTTPGTVPTLKNSTLTLTSQTAFREIRKPVVTPSFLNRFRRNSHKT